MVQDSSSGSGPDKRNWRERLGIGATDMPKLSDEFRDEQPAAGAAPDSAVRAPQPVTKPAPMAPRVPRKPQEQAPGATAERPAVSVSRATPRAPDNATQDALAEKLRAQRAAAERLAEQRVLAARQKAEGKTAAPAGAGRSMTPPPAGPRPAGAPGATGRPRFGFADDGRSSATNAAGAPLTPPRPSLGGERGQPPFLRPSTGNGGNGGRSLTSYRSGEVGSGYAGTPRLSAPSRSGLGGEAAGYSGTRLTGRRASSTDLYARRPEPRDAGPLEDGTDDRGAGRLGRPGAPAAAGDLDEIFEDEVTQRPRATARDYQSAYQQGDEFFAEEAKRSSGPWLLLLALLVAAIATGAVVWFYSDSVRNLANGVTGITTGGDSQTVPVVNAPEDPSKVAPESATTGDAASPAAQKKQIYDRIVGEQEVMGGQVQPTEETPVAPGEVQPANQIPQAQPAAGSDQIPAPDAVDQTTGQGLPEVEPPPPLPLPPPGTGQEGSLPANPAAQVAAASAPPEQGATAPPMPAAIPEASPSSANALPPPPEKATDGAALVSEAASAVDTAAMDAKIQDTTNTQAAAPVPETPVPEAAAPAASEPEPAPPPKKKAATKKKAKQDFDNLGSEPVVLVPPSQAPAAEGVGTAPVPEAPAGDVAQPPAAAKKKTIFDIFGNSDSATEPAGTEVAAVEQPAPPKAETAGGTGSGYTIQLASYRSQAEASDEYSRLSQAYPAAVGRLPSLIRETSVAGSTRYQLSLGPLNSRGEATKVCSELIAGGESDCIVRGP